MGLSNTARRVCRANNALKSTGATQQDLSHIEYPCSTRRAFSRTSHVSDDTPVLRYGIFAQKQPASGKPGINVSKSQPEKQPHAKTVVKHPGASITTTFTPNGSDSGKAPVRASRYAHLLKGVRAARQAEADASRIRVQMVESAFPAEAAPIPSPTETEVVNLLQIEYVENNNATPIPRYKQLAKRLWASRREQVFGAMQEEQVALMSNPARAEAARQYAEKVKASIMNPWASGRLDSSLLEMNDLSWLISDGPESPFLRHLWLTRGDTKVDWSFRSKVDVGGLADGSASHAFPTHRLGVSEDVLFRTRRRTTYSRYYEQARAALQLLRHNPPRINVLLPDLEPSELDRQLLWMIREINQNRTLAQFSRLRPYERPEDAAAMTIYFIERVNKRVEGYYRASEALDAAAELAWSAIYTATRRSRRQQRGQGDDRWTRIFAHFKQLRTGIMVIRRSLRPITQEVLLAGYIVGRDTLFNDMQNDRMVSKARAHAAIILVKQFAQAVTGASDVRAAIRHRIISSRYVSEIGTWIRNLKQIKILCQSIQKKQERHIALEKLESVMDLTHPYYMELQSVQVELADIRDLYFRACKAFNLNYLAELDWILRMIHNLQQSMTARQITTLIRRIHLIQAATISRKYEYQTWPESAPEPVLPDFVQDAIRIHRQKHGNDSIF